MLSCIIINAIVTWILLLQRFHLFLFYKEIESTFEMSINVIIFWLTIITRFIVIFHSWKCTFDATLALFYFVSSMHSKAIKSLLKFKKIICSLTIRLHSIPIWKLRKEKRPSVFLRTRHHVQFWELHQYVFVNFSIIFSLLY